MSNEKIYPIRTLAVRSTRLGDSTFLSVGSDTFELDEVATHIWRRCNGGKTVEEIAASIESDYDVEIDIAANDTREFLAELEDSGLITWQTETDKEG
ncbi:PqqD family protein [Paenarthrobacter nicotinovorans]|uniref:PqqD family protein n=1 Tax=Paenarthrobacter nicotinovorans TaxID=29320 RepID=UPI003D67C636